MAGKNSKIYYIFLLFVTLSVLSAAGCGGVDRKDQMQIVENRIPDLTGSVPEAPDNVSVVLSEIFFQVNEDIHGPAADKIFLTNRMLNVLIDSKKFQKVYYRNAPPLLPEDKRYILHIDVMETYEDEVDWLWTWPVVFPFVGIWPFQIKDGQVTLEMILRVYEEEKYVGTYKYVFAEKYDMVFYGLYRNDALDDAAMTVMNTGLTALNKDIQNWESFLEKKLYLYESPLNIPEIEGLKGFTPIP